MNRTCKLNNRNTLNFVGQTFAQFKYLCTYLTLPYLTLIDSIREKKTVRIRSVEALCADGLRIQLYDHSWLIHGNSC